MSGLQPTPDPDEVGPRADLNPSQEQHTESTEHSASASEQIGPETGKGLGTGRVMVMAGAGLELAATVLLFGAIGALVDRWLQTEQPLGLVFVGLLGFALAMYRFVRQAVEATRRATAETGSKRADVDG